MIVEIIGKKSGEFIGQIAGDVIGMMTGAMSNHLWQSTWFAIAAALLALSFRKNRAQVRHCLWLSASLKFLIPFSLLMNLGNSLWYALAARKIAMAIAPPAVSLTMAQITQPFPDTFSIASSAPLAPNWIFIAVLTMWACGFAAIALMRFRGWLRIRAAMHASTPINISASVAVRSSQALLEPGVVGILRPILLLPEGILNSLTPSQLEAVLAHELCHIRRRDNLTAAIHMLVEAVFWFHPVVWWTGARLVEERERACDEAVLSLGSEPREYVEAILNVCKLYIESPLACVSGISGSDLKKRIVRIMTRHLGDDLTFGRKLILVVIATAAIVGPVVFGLVNAPLLRAQSSIAGWEKAAGGKMSFDVASVKPNKLDGAWHSNVGLTEGGNLPPSGDLFSATGVPLNLYIAFAYKITPRQSLLLRPLLPKWASTERFDIEAKAPIRNPTKDQMRLMVQSLLLERFKLAVHWDSRDAPVYAFVLETPGKTGPTLQAHSVGPPCAPQQSPSSPQLLVDGLPPTCGVLAPLPSSKSGRKHFGVRNASMGQIVGYLQVLGNLDREVFDRTGLSGTFDFSIEWTPEFNEPSEPSESNGPPPNFQPDSTGPTFLEALKDQLGLKLDSTTGPVQTLVVDYIEEPSPN